MSLVQAKRQYVTHLNAENTKNSFEIDINGEERPQYLLCMKILAADSMKPCKFKMHLETLHEQCVGKTPDLFTKKKLKCLISKNKNLQI
jgi:hypothetical protein